jgi:ribosomal protein S18 acetylase RimI-like enzyme
VLEIRALAGVGWEALAAAFNEGFRDYLMPVTMSPAALEAMQVRRGYVPSLSFGAYAGDELVGFVLTCVDGDRAYNSGTGVAPAHRRGGVARRLVDEVIAHLGARSYLLEVLEPNEKAAALYRSAGFVETRRFDCWTFEGEPADAPVIAAPDLDAIAADGDVELSWQNSVASIRRAIEPYLVLGDRHGAVVVFPDSADLALLQVGPTFRRRGHGRRLLRAAAARCTRPVRILNVDDRASGIASFLRAVGAKPLVRQIEMVRQP